MSTEQAIRRIKVFVSHLVFSYEDCCDFGLYVWYTDGSGMHWANQGETATTVVGFFIPPVYER